MLACMYMCVCMYAKKGSKIVCRNEKRYKGGKNHHWITSDEKQQQTTGEKGQQA